MGQCTVLYEAWQMSCCGNHFSNKDNIKWLVCDGMNARPPSEIEKIDYCYEAHSSDYKNIYILEGKVKKIMAVYQNYSRIEDNPRIRKALDGFLIEINSSKEIESKIENADFYSYIVWIEDYSSRQSKENEVTFR